MSVFKPRPKASKRLREAATPNLRTVRRLTRFGRQVLWLRDREEARQSASTPRPCSAFVPAMGGPVDPRRIFRLRHLSSKPVNGWIRLAVCGSCGHQAPVPVDRLVRRYGDLLPVDEALMRLRCARCGKLGEVTLRHVRLCEPGCPKQRG